MTIGVANNAVATLSATDPDATDTVLYTIQPNVISGTHTYLNDLAYKEYVDTDIPYSSNYSVTFPNVADFRRNNADEGTFVAVFTGTQLLYPGMTAAEVDAAPLVTSFGRDGYAETAFSAIQGQNVSRQKYHWHLEDKPGMGLNGTVDRGENDVFFFGVVSSNHGRFLHVHIAESDAGTFRIYRMGAGWCEGSTFSGAHTAEDAVATSARIL